MTFPKYVTTQFKERAKSIIAIFLLIFTKIMDKRLEEYAKTLSQR